MSENKETEVVSEEAPKAKFGLEDIYNGMQIFDYAANQGAFKGWETTVQVLNVRTTYFNFLKENMPNFEEVMSGKKAEEVKTAAPVKKAKGKK